MKTIRLENFKAFEDLYNKYEQRPEADDLKNVIVLFVADDDKETGKSWCPDCVLAKPVIEAALKKFEHNEQVALVVAPVGQRDEWKTPENPYRKHALKITCVPTLVGVPNGLRLNGSECSDPDKVAHLFSNSL